MPDPRPTTTPAKRALGWIILIGGFGLWLFSGVLFPGNGALYDAISAGDAARVRQLLATGADPNSQSSPLTLTRTSTRRYLYSPLVFALRQNEAEVALALVEAGADPNAKDLNGRTALALAVSQHMPAMEQALLARGARPVPPNPLDR